MTEREKLEKVIKGLKCCMSGQPEGLGCDRVPCPYNDIEDCEGALHYDALALLKAQEPRTETQGRWERVGFDIMCCSECGMPMKKTHICFPDGESGYYYIATKYCPHCGAKNEKGDCDV